jgi:glycosyltransferase 2 family protein
VRVGIAALAKLCLSIALAWYALSRVDFSGVAARLPSLAGGWAAASVGLVLAQFALASLRYQRILAVAGRTLPLRVTFDTVMIGAFFSQTLASFIGGDAVRAWRIVKEGVPIRVAIASVVLDRVFGFVGLTLFILAGLPAFFEVVRTPLTRWALVVLIAGVLAACVFLLLAGSAPARHRRFRLIAAVARLGEHWRAQLAAPGPALLLVAISIIIQALNVLTVYAAARGLGVALELGICMALLPPVLMLAMLPISFAGWGVRESAMLIALGLVGISALESVAISVCYGLAVLAASAPGGIIWLWDRRALGARRERDGTTA